MTTLIEQAKQTCVERLLVPWEGTGPRTPTGGFLAYPDPATNGAPYTIAWGLTYHPDGRAVLPNEQWDYDYALWAKAQVLNRFVVQVLALSPGLLREHKNKLAAILSFAYNVGIGNYKISTLRRLVNERRFLEAAEQFVRWNKANGRVMRGLTLRRLAESKLFLDLTN